MFRNDICESIPLSLKGVAGGESQSPPLTPAPQVPHLQTHNTTKLSKETRGIHIMLIGTNKLTRMKMSEGRRSLLWPFWHWGHVSGLTRTHLPKRHAVTSIYSSFKAHTYELWEKPHTACRVIWWGHLHVQLLYSRNQKLPCEYPQAIRQRCGADMRRYGGTAAACLSGSSDSPIRLVIWLLWLPSALTEVTEGRYEMRQLTEEDGNTTPWQQTLRKRHIRRYCR